MRSIFRNSRTKPRLLIISTISNTVLIVITLNGPSFYLNLRYRQACTCGVDQGEYKSKLDAENCSLLLPRAITRVPSLSNPNREIEDRMSEDQRAISNIPVQQAISDHT